MSATPTRQFDFHCKRHACRRDRGAQPRNLLLGFNAAMRVVEYHPAGEVYVHERPVTEALEDREFISGFDPMHAARIGVAAERTRQSDLGERVRGLHKAAGSK
ncbi:hypothetical protein [Salinisphaera hydrothermalis]|uniref:hypothetical protein n=1 Tax=Salinisphaera hydrothermalis TaxID=563188 RepID=UPI00333EC213